MGYRFTAAGRGDTRESLGKTKAAPASQKFSPANATPLPSTSTTLSTLVVEMEQVHHVADGGTVQRDVGVAPARFWIGEVVAAAMRHRR